jgi:hypothetical protein
MQRYVPYENHLAMFFLKPHVKMPGRVIGQPGEEGRVGFGDAVRRACESFPFRVFAYGYKQLPDGIFDPGCVYPVSWRV